MKKILLSLLLISVSLFSSTILTQDNINTSVKKETILRNYISQYILDTGEFPTKDTLTSYFNLSSDMYTNTTNEINAITFTTTSKGIQLNNILSITPNSLSTELKETYKNSVYQPNFITISTDYSYNFVPYSSKVLSIVNFINNLKSNEIISFTEPSVTKYVNWYKPIGNGLFTLYQKTNSDTWAETNYNSSSQVLGYETSSFDVDSNCTNDDTATTSDGTSLISYICIEGKWFLKNNVSDDDQTLFKGYTSLQNLVCNMWNKAGASEVYDIPTHPYTGTTKNFTKFDDSDTDYNGYWISDDFLDIVVTDMKDLVHYREKYNKQTTGYMCLNNQVVVAKWIPVNNNNQWVYLTESYKDMFDNYLINMEDWNNNNNYLLSWDYIVDRNSSDKKLFQLTPTLTNNKDIYYSKYSFQDNNQNVDNTIEISNKLSNFTNFGDDIYYLVKTNTCATDKTCFGNGLGNSSIFNGSFIEDFYVFFYDINNKLMVDAKISDSLSDMYSKNLYAYYYNNDIYYKIEDINGNTCYQRQDGKYITLNNDEIPSMYINSDGVLNLPPSLNCQTVTFDNNNIIIVSNRTNLVNWINANKNFVAKVKNISEYYTKKSKTNPDYWESNTERLTYSGRDLMINITNNNKVYLTKNLGIKTDINDDNKNYRYSDDGFPYTEDTSFYQWFAANTTKSVNNMIDGDCENIYYTSNACNLYYNTRKFDFNNYQCNVSITDEDCPKVYYNGSYIQSKYDKNYNICYININENNQFCSSSDLIYSKTLKTCYKKITDDNCYSGTSYYNSKNQCKDIPICSDTSYTYNLSYKKCVKTIYTNNRTTLTSKVNYNKKFTSDSATDNHIYGRYNDGKIYYKNSSGGYTEFTFSYNNEISFTPYCASGYSFVFSNYKTYNVCYMRSGYVYNVYHPGAYGVLGTFDIKDYYLTADWTQALIINNNCTLSAYIHSCKNLNIDYKKVTLNAGDSKPEYSTIWGKDCYDYETSTGIPPGTNVMNKGIIGTVKLKEGKCVKEICPSGYTSKTIGNTLYCYKNSYLTPTCKYSNYTFNSDGYCYGNILYSGYTENYDTSLGDVLTDSLITPSGMTYNSSKNRFEISLKNIDKSKLVFNNYFTSNNYIYLNYDYVNDTIYYTPSDLTCSTTKMNYSIGLDTPYYYNNDGNCYSVLGEACLNSGFTNQSHNY